ncbi:MAG: DUF4097 domain-containing protein [Candidatus Aminicenantes bacterium]|nr:DUF4097 domain-containing protein [Candidatus Aminicenantes bacterium]
MKAREVVLAILIILAGTAVSLVKSGRIGWDGDVGDFVFSRGEEFVFEDVLEIDPPLPGRIEILNARGSVTVEAAETDTAAVGFKKRIVRRTREEAEQLSGELKMIVNRTEDRLILSTNREDFRRRTFETDFQVAVPAGSSVLIKNSRGPVRTTGTGPTEISNFRGDVVAASVGGTLVLEASYGSVTVDGVHGQARLTCPQSDVVVKNVQGDLVIDHCYGRIRVENASERLTINGRHSKVLARNIGGEAEIRTTYEPVTVIQGRDVIIRGHHNAVTITDTTGTCDIANEYGSVRLDNLAGDVKFQGRKAGFVGRGVRAGTLSIVTSYENVDLRGFTGEATISVGHAAILLEPEEITGPLTVEGNRADIRFLWPAEARNPFEAEARQGTIFWGLALPPSSATTNGTPITKAFLEETGRPAVVLRTTYGDIRVEESPRRPS